VRDTEASADTTFSNERKGIRRRLLATGKLAIALKVLPCCSLFGACVAERGLPADPDPPRVQREPAAAINDSAMPSNTSPTSGQAHEDVSPPDIGDAAPEVGEDAKPDVELFDPAPYREVALHGCDHDLMEPQPKLLSAKVLAEFRNRFVVHSVDLPVSTPASRRPKRRSSICVITVTFYYQTPVVIIHGSARTEKLVPSVPEIARIKQVTGWPNP
jgi:hypothetical protein